MVLHCCPLVQGPRAQASSPAPGISHSDATVTREEVAVASEWC